MEPLKLILVVDDHPINRKLIMSVINRKGFRTLEAGDGAQALAIVRAERPELVISDILMSTVDGFEFVRQLRDDPAVAHTKVIFCTATYHEHEAGELARTAGVFRVLSKPCKPDDLMEAVEHALADGPVPTLAELASGFDRAHVQLMTDKLSAQEAAMLRAQRVARLAHVISRADGSFESWSETLCELTGLDSEDIPRNTRAWLELVHPDHREAFRAASVDAAKSRERREIEYLMRQADGSWISVFHVFDPIMETAHGTAGRWFSTMQDVTARVQAQEEVRRLNADLEVRVAERTLELEAAMKELESFDYSISHDLRSPVTRIQGFAEILAADHAAGMNEQGRDLVNRIVSSAARIEELVTDLFSLSTVSRGDLRRSRVDISELARTVAAVLQRAEPERHVAIEVANDLTAWADPGLARIVLENLIGNAWKFTRRREGARIEVGRAIDDDSAGPAFFVRDNGAGFDPAKAAKLFSPFQRLHANSDFEGTGIGLATVSRVVVRHGGHVSAKGVPGQGATFTFTLSR